jgi:regulatory protein
MGPGKSPRDRESLSSASSLFNGMSAPPTISSITPDPRRPGRFEIEVDGRRVATVSIALIEERGLAPGAAWESHATAVQGESELLEAYDRALTMLASRGRSSATLKRLLVRKGVEPGTASAAVQRLMDAGIIDDSAFARQFARTKAVGAGLSRRRIAQELFRHGIPRDVAEGAIADTYEAEAVDEAAVAEAVARKKARTLRTLDPRTRGRRLWAFLARRGFSVETIRLAVSKVTYADDLGGEGGDTE